VRFLCDESVDIAVIAVLRRDDHDVVAIAEVEPGAPDLEVAALANAEGRILITEDRDFGRIVYAELQPIGAVIYLRYPAAIRLEFAAQVTEFVRDRGSSLEGAFVVMQPGRSRIGRLPRQ
jgi:predicted nuclease of predicted toxin-antitoxin system